MEKFDKNYIIGFVLLFLMYGTYLFFYSAPEEVSADNPKTAAATTKSTKDVSTQIAAIADTAALKSKYGVFSANAGSETKLVVLENEDIKVTLSSMGANIKEVVLKKYKTYDAYQKGEKEAMILMDDVNAAIRMEATTLNGKIDLKTLQYDEIKKVGNKVTFKLNLGANKSIEQSYQLNEKGFALDYNMKFNGLEGLVTSDAVSFSWENKLIQLEHDMLENRKAAQVNYYTTEEEFEDVGYGSVDDSDDKAEQDVKWFSFKQKYFTTGIISEEGGFQNLNVDIKTDEKDTVIVKDATVTATIPTASLSAGKGNYRFYFGPNDFATLKAVGDDFHQNLYLGYDIVKPINRFVFVPLFNWFEKYVNNYGFLIILVVLAIKIALTPLIYKSYVSSAKMRVLSPEIAEIKQQVGDDQVKVQQETMKLYQQVGVSPLSGCVPMLLQMPILMSVFFLFPNMVMFRQKAFLWANDLSTYDAPISWAYSLPIIGNHISLFVVLMTVSSLAFTYYNNQVTPDQPGPIDMKKISYIFPLVFFFVLNSFPAALSFYYLVSNVVTIGQQLIVKRFVDEDKIRSILEENKKNFHTKPKKTNKFADYLQKQLQVQEEANKQKSDTLKKKRK